MKSILRILHLEDEPNDAELIRSSLHANDLNSTILRVETREEFANALNADKFDLIIADFSLPTFDGISALKIAKEKAPLVPFILVSGTIGAEAAITSLISGATDYVLKGELSRLAPAVRRALREAEEIQHRRRAEAELRSNEVSFRLLFANNPLPMWVYDLESLSFLEVNEAAVLKYGYSRAEFLQMQITRIRPPEDVQRLKEELHNQRSSIQHNSRWRHRLKDGRTIDVEITSHTLEFAGRNAALVVAQDVTERTRAEEGLKLFRTLVDRSNDAIEVVDPVTGRFLDMNEKACLDLGYSRKELLSMTIFDINPDLERATFATGREGLRKSGSMILESLHRRKDGSIFPVEINIKYVMLDRDYNVNVVRDITERKRAEAALIESEERFRLISENVADLIAVLDLTGRRVYSSPSYRNILGDPAQLSGTDSFQEIHPEDREKVKILFRDTVEKGVGQRGEYRLVSQDGAIHHVESQGSVIRDRDGKITNVVVVSRDITEKKMLEQQFFRAQRLESLGTLAGGIAHDLNNVLSPILLSLQMLKDLVTSDIGQRMLQILETSAMRGSEIVKQVLTFGRGITGERGPIQPRHIIREIVSIMKETFPKSITIRDDIAKDIWTIEGDATQCHQLIMNLCVNARDAMPQGGELTISAENRIIDEQYARMHVDAREGRFVMLSVADTGTGIPPDILDRMFEPFYTTKDVGKGTGLGLSTVHTIVKGHQGFMNVHSEMGKGTIFRVYLPSSGGEDPGKIQEGDVTLMEGHGELVLVVDDEASICQITKQTLEACGYRVVTANDGTEAVAMYVTHRTEIALVLTDMMMPIMDGPRTIAALRKLNPEVRIIASSGLMSGGGSESADQLGVDGFIVKPYTAAALLKIIHTILKTPRQA